MLQRFLDGELEPSAAQRVAEHLAACERCCGETRMWRAVTAHVRTLREPSDPGALLRLEQLVDRLTHAAH